jgi:hypothetical protein
MKKLAAVWIITSLCGVMGALAHTPAGDPSASALPWPRDLPVYEHVVIVIEENKYYDQIIDSADAPYINGALRKEGANFTRMFGEEHDSEGNYFWLFSGDNQGVGFHDAMPKHSLDKPNLGQALIANGKSFKGYAEDLPYLNDPVERSGRYARKHVPWISFTNLPRGATAATSSNLRFSDFPTDETGFSRLPTVAFVIPNLDNDMHNGKLHQAIRRGDAWLKEHLDAYYQWAKTHHSLLILTFDETDKTTHFLGLTDPAADSGTPLGKDVQNRIATIFAGDHIRPGDYDETKGITHVNILRTLEAMYGLPRSGAQQVKAAASGIKDDFLITDIFESLK